MIASPSMTIYVTQLVMYCVLTTSFVVGCTWIHTKRDTGVWREIFLDIIQEYGLPHEKGLWLGVTVDIAWPIVHGFAEAFAFAAFGILDANLRENFPRIFASAVEHVRFCRVHAMRAFRQQCARVTKGAPTTLFHKLTSRVNGAFRVYFEYAKAHGHDPRSEGFSKFAETLALLGSTFANWWIASQEGAAMPLLFGHKRGSLRSLLHETTNAVEGAHAVAMYSGRGRLYKENVTRGISLLALQSLDFAQKYNSALQKPARVGEKAGKKHYRELEARNQNQDE